MTLIHLKEKVRCRWTQIQKKLHIKKTSDDKYWKFNGSHENYLTNGALVLEESIALFHGKTNPIRHVSVDELNNMNVERHPFYRKEFCTWYKGSWEGRIVSVKMTGPDHSNMDLLREIVVASQMATHNNVHKLLACCLYTNSPVLVYEWVGLYTLQDYISFGDKNQNIRVLELKHRLRIAWEISHSIAYLHTAFPKTIIHRDLIPRNVLLDESCAAKLCNFSSCVYIPEGKEFAETDTITGTLYYLAPEYVKSGIVAESTDVYSFGMLFLTLLIGKPAFKIRESYEVGTPTWVLNSIKNNSINKIIDPALTSNGVSDTEALQLRASLHLVLGCITKEIDMLSMVEVATVLKNIITSPENILESSSFKEGGIFRIFSGSKENIVRNEGLLIQESTSLFYGKTNPIRYFSVDDLNSMNVEYSHFCSLECCNLYKGSWEGTDVLVKLPNKVNRPSRSYDEIRLMFVREIAIGTQTATHENVHTLIGCCLETVFPVIVYEGVSRETFEDHI